MTFLLFDHPILNIPCRDLQDVIPEHPGLWTIADNCPHSPLLFLYFIKNGKSRRIICRKGCTLLDLYRIQNSVFLYDHVDLAFDFDCLAVSSYFFSVSSPVVRNAISIIHSPVGIGFQDLRYDKCFEKGTAHCAIRQCFRCQPASKVSSETGVAKIDLWSLDCPV